jgi:sugar phosphate isomerase/epimerase
MNSSRRSFIKNSSIVIAGTTLLPHNYAVAAGKKEELLGVQLYSVDKEMHEDAAGTLKALGKIGYKYVEHAGYSSRKFYGYPPSDFRKLLNDCGLNLLSGHSVLELKHWNKTTRQFTREWQHTIEDAVTAGQKFLISPWLDRSLWNDESALKHFMDVFNRSGELCNNAALQFGYHNHDFEFTHTFNSLRLYDIILQHTTPHLVSQQLDIGNIYQKDFSATDLFDQYPGRFQLMHVKDVIETNERHQQFTSAAIGEGVLNIKHIIDKARQQGGTSCFIIAQDDYGSANTFKCASNNYNAFNNI